MPQLLAALPAHACHWPLTMAGGEHLFCGAKAARAGLPYCAGHMLTAWRRGIRPQTPAERMALIRVAVMRRAACTNGQVRHWSGEEMAMLEPDQRANLASCSTPSGAPEVSDNLSATPALRPVAPICIKGLTPHAPPTGEPIFERVNPADLLVDETYQRDLSPKSIALIQKIVSEWDWRRFKPPVVAFADGGLQVIDGQHTAIAAASHPDIEAIPVMVVEAPELQSRALAFIGHNRDRLQVTAMQLHHAAVAAGEDSAVTVEQVCARAGVILVRSAYGGRQWKAGETTAINAVRALTEKRGAQRARQILDALVQAGLAPILTHHIKAAEMLFSQADYAEQLEVIGDGGAADLAQAIKALGDGADKEARVFAAAQCVPYWRALGVIWFRKCRKRRKAAA